MSTDAPPEPSPGSCLLVAADPAAPAATAVRLAADRRGVPLDVLDSAAFLAEPALAARHTRIIAVADDLAAPRLIEAARTADRPLALVPDAPSRMFADWFHLPRSTVEAVALAFDAVPAPLDLLVCNERLVLGQVMLGKLPFLDRRSKTYRERSATLSGRIAYAGRMLRRGLANLREIKPFPVALTTGKDRTLKTAITGLVILENETGSPAARLLNTSVSVQDHKLSTILVAPTSVAAYLGFLGAALFKGDHSVKRLPGAVSYLKTSTLTITSPEPLTYYADGERHTADRIDLAVHPKAVRMVVGPTYLAAQGGTEEEKDTLRIEHLPEQKDRVAMIQRHLPLFTRALEEDFKDLFQQLRQISAIRVEFVVLTLLSTLIASLGMFLDSTAVIIGAMVLAPLMAPIIALAMGLLRGDLSLIRRPLQTLGTGVLLVLGLSALLAVIQPAARITPEIAARIQPTLLDLGVAIASGIAGAYAYSRESVARSLPGVAIAVALVPPLCVTGIGIGWLDADMVRGASLLFLTNLIGIALAGALTFLVLGYAPVVRSRRGLTISLGLLVAVAIPLSISFRNMHQNWFIEQAIAREIYPLGDRTVRLHEVEVRNVRGELHIRATSIGRDRIRPEDLPALQHRLAARWQRPVALELDARLGIDAATSFR